MRDEGVMSSAVIGSEVEVAEDELEVDELADTEELPA